MSATVCTCAATSSNTDISIATVLIPLCTCSGSLYSTLMIICVLLLSWYPASQLYFKIHFFTVDFRLFRVRLSSYDVQANIALSQIVASGSSA